MKKNFILSALIALTITSVSALGQSVVKENRDVDGFTKVSFGLSGNLYINIGPEFKVVLEGDKDDLEDIITDVSGGRLVIKKENWRFNLNEKVTINITMPEIEGLGVSGSGRAEIRDAVKTNDLNLSVSGSGKLYTADIQVSNLDCSISGSGNINVGGGSIGECNLSISGSGNYTGESAKISDADISISGSGNCTCYVTETLKGGISGSGNVSYLGDPRIDVRISGSGKVRSR